MNHALRSILVLFPICVHVFQVVTFLQAFHPPKKAYFPPYMRRTLSIISSFCLMPQIISNDKYKLRRSSLRDFLRPPITSSLLGPSISFSALFSNTPLLRNVGNQVSHHTNIHRQVTVLCPQNLHFSVANWGVGEGNSGLPFSRHSPNFIDPLFLHVRSLVSLISFPNI